MGYTILRARRLLVAHSQEAAEECEMNLPPQRRNAKCNVLNLTEASQSGFPSSDCAKRMQNLRRRCLCWKELASLSVLHESKMKMKQFQNGHFQNLSPEGSSPKTSLHSMNREAFCTLSFFSSPL